MDRLSLLIQNGRITVSGPIAQLTRTECETLRQGLVRYDFHGLLRFPDDKRTVEHEYKA